MKKEIIVGVDENTLQMYEMMGMENKYKLVRCKNCANREEVINENRYYCGIFEGYVTESDYCSWAVIK